MTHDLPKVSPLIWVAEPTFEEEPTTDDVASIESWRWCVFFPVGAAVRRKLVHPIGKVSIPDHLRPLPRMRSGSIQQGWQMVAFDEGGSPQPDGPATDPSVPIFQVVNDTRLKEMIVSGWRSRDEW